MKNLVVVVLLVLAASAVAGGECKFPHAFASFLVSSAVAAERPSM